MDASSCMLDCAFGGFPFTFLFGCKDDPLLDFFCMKLDLLAESCAHSHITTSTDAVLGKSFVSVMFCHSSDCARLSGHRLRRVLPCRTFAVVRTSNDACRKYSSTCRFAAAQSRLQWRMSSGLSRPTQTLRSITLHSHGSPLTWHRSTTTHSPASASSTHSRYQNSIHSTQHAPQQHPNVRMLPSAQPATLSVAPMTLCSRKRTHPRVLEHSYRA